MDYAVRFRDVTKEYPLYKHISAGIKSFLFHLPKHVSSFRQARFMALNGVSFEIGKGETFGIIGKNGSGKSTILGLIAGVMHQDKGTVETDGRLSSLLELGAGFHPDLSGMENIILNGILMGNTRKDMEEKAAAIVEFSELGDFIYQPLRTYSSGMHVRLGFSVAVHIEPEILLIDEALAVGDLGFQEKCLAKMKDFRKSGATIIIVSHDMESVGTFCDRAIWLDKGVIRDEGRPAEVIRKYLSSIGRVVESPEKHQEEERGDGQSEVVPDAKTEKSWWDSSVILRHVEDVITGDSSINLYDFLKQGHIHSPLEKGLSICRRLQGLEAKFLHFDICRSFDVLDNSGVEQVLRGEWAGKTDTYDLLLFADILGGMRRIDTFLEKTAHFLKANGYLVAFEHVGLPTGAPAEKLQEIAQTLLGSVTERGGLTKSAVAVAELPGPEQYHALFHALELHFDIITVRPFGSPLYELLFNPLMNEFDSPDKKDTRILETITRLDDVLQSVGAVQASHAMIVARKRGRTP